MSDAAVQVVCSWCGSTDVCRDAWAEWDVARQEWVAAQVFDDGYCKRCDAERSLEVRPVVLAEVALA